MDLQDEHKRLMAAEKVLVIGGGIVGVELAGALAFYDLTILDQALAVIEACKQAAAALTACATPQAPSIASKLRVATSQSSHGMLIQRR